MSKELPPVIYLGQSEQSRTILDFEKREKRRASQRTPEYRAWKRAYQQTPEYKEYARQYRLWKKQYELWGY